MQEVTLTQVLEAREERVRKQQALLKTYHCPLICFTMNIAGPVKTTPLTQCAFQVGLDALHSKLPQKHIRFHSTEITVTGCLAMYAIDIEAITLKKICTEIEDSIPLGRLFDMDVLDRNGLKLERHLVGGKSRNCIICGAPGRACAARRLHTVPELQAATLAIIQGHFAINTQPESTHFEHIAAMAVQSLIDEAMTTPKPGLVDMRNNGSHQDMNLYTFLRSAHAMKPYFLDCLQIGQSTRHMAPVDTFPQLREAGLKAEQAMYTVTGGVNTHKGAIYSLGILCGALGRLWSSETPIAEVNALMKQCAEMVTPHVEADFTALSASHPAITDSMAITGESKPQTTLSAGQRLYLEEGITGIRGEAAAGFPSVMRLSLPAYKNALQAGLNHNDAGIIALLHLIANVNDTNLYHRGGHDGAAYAANAAHALLDANKPLSYEQLEDLDDAFIARNLSPGGCADLLAVTYFLYRLN
ncbi:MAG: triphosphoribosyl-dephospho-CoA synthase CitG [Lachnospiraceae bacterium]|nr:triphosphoribosyl-dephospho-CoA synthase CitG [Lachnospiraceae bacterium]